MKNKIVFPVLCLLVVAGSFNSCKKKIERLPDGDLAISKIEISSLIKNTATIDGFIDSDGGSAITQRGVCWSTSQNPTTANSKTSNGSGIDNFTATINGLTDLTTYYVRAYIINNTGTGYSNQVTITTNFAPSVGNDFAGGKVAYLFKTGDPGFIAGEAHGIIASVVDQAANAEWGCAGTLISGADDINFTAGKQNTLDILNGCASSNIAASACDNFVLFNYNDWYLPSKNELNALYLNKDAVGGFGSGIYWSSSEEDKDLAWRQNFATGDILVEEKNIKGRARAIRYF